MMKMNSSSKLGVALVGLGSYSEKELAPALKETEHCRLVSAVSGDPEKLARWQRKYDLDDKNLFTYENFDQIQSSPEIDIVYIVLPNSMHAEYTIRAAKAGKHVICEKPMATSVEDCHRMIEACKQAGVRLSIGYRLHFDPFNQEMMRLGHNRAFGRITGLEAKNGMDVGKKDQWRVKKSLAGGGPLMDLGIYCVQGVIYTLGELPVSVTARFSEKTNPEKFNEVEEGIEWEMEFSYATIAKCETSYSKEFDLLRAHAEKGTFELEPAYEYRGLKGKSPEGKFRFPTINQQAAQMDDFARCIKEGSETRVPGEMGLRDVQILMAIYEAAKTGKKVELDLEHFEKLVEM